MAVIAAPVYRRELGSEGGRHLPEVAQLVKGRTGIWTVKPCCHHLEGPVLGTGNTGWTSPGGTHRGAL